MSNKIESLSVITNQLPDSQVADVAGGGDCDASISAGSGGINISTTPGSLGPDVIATYEGLIEATSYAIERIANSLK
jgi:hypothetical protein